MHLIDNLPSTTPDYYGQALAAYRRRGVPNPEMAAAFFAAMSESLDILLKAADGTD